MKSNNQTIALCLAMIAVSLLVVGIVSGTVIRHFIQIAPILLAMMVLTWRPSAAAYAAMPIFLNWALIAVLIWLYLFGLSRIARGHYTAIEIVMTVVMALCSVLGAVASIRLGVRSPLMPRLSAFVLFLGLQVAAMWVSFLRPFASR